MQSINNTLQNFLNKGILKTYPANTYLLKEGEYCNRWIYLKKGIIRHCFITLKGKDFTKNFITENNFSFSSISSFLEKAPSRIEFQTLTKCEILEWSKTDFEDFIKTIDGQQLFNQITKDLILKKEKKEISILKDDAEKRYTDFMNTLGFLFNIVPHYHIASYLSMSPETLSRIRRKNIS